MNPNIPNRFPAEYAERTLLTTFSLMGDLMLQVEMKFDHNLDHDRMRKAFQLSLIAEPILGCRFVYHPRRPYWERNPENGKDNLQIIQDESEYEQFKYDTIEPKIGPAFNGVILTQDKGDTLLLKIAHAAADAGGAKDIAYLISELYTKLEQNPDFIPQPNVNGSRSIRQVFKRIPWYASFRIFINSLIELISVVIPANSHNPTSESNDLEGFGYVTRQISAKRVRKIVEYGNAHQAKINDLIMAAFFRSLMRTNWNRKAMLRVAMTIDLRRWYLPGGRAETICNLSGIEVCGLGKNPGENYKDTLEKIVLFTKRRKKSWLGLNVYLGMILFVSWWSYKHLIQFSRIVIKKMIRNQSIFPIFTNLGPIDESRLVFDQKPIDATVLVPTGHPPFLGIGMSGYAGTLTLSAGTFKTTHDTIEKMFDIMLEELPPF